MPAPRPSNPTGLTRADRIAKRSLAITLREMISDETIGEALIAIAFEGRWPTHKVATGGRPRVEVHPAAAGMAAMSSAPDGAQRMMALKYLLERRDGMPMQAILLKAEIDARQRTLDASGDAIDLDALDTEAAEILERSLMKALGAGNLGAGNLGAAVVKPALPVIDVEPTSDGELEGEDTE